ncbi:hypothetical protein BJ508DRAFT_418059 [Ascobolus immersus RN42]|uniref:AMMECR1 domain-containing protein n=1 Tax=Ascobolus immersus RN42 TaxID=1160509 RepID=A0A3N4HP31_ASCIM|nr:hypothetical protein BJ508DRAFT_418059 [Ascobolus immersus RN42]
MATIPHCLLAFETLTSILEKRPPLPLSSLEKLYNQHLQNTSGTSSLPEELPPTQLPASTTESANSTSTYASVSAAEKDGVLTSAPLFVTWNKRRADGEKELRGCIGTFTAQPIEEGVKEYARIAAFEDSRFSPITARELPTLEAAISLLTNFEPCADPYDWDLETHGIRISFVYHGRKLGATYLPDVAKEQGWTKEETLQSLMRKAGWAGSRGRWREVVEGAEAGFKVVRYRSSKARVGYKTYKEVVGR